MHKEELPAPHLPATAPGANARTTAARQRHHTIEVQARILEYDRRSIVALVVRDNARGLDVEPITVFLSLDEATRVGGMLFDVVRDIRMADARNPERKLSALEWHATALRGEVLTAAEADGEADDPVVAVRRLYERLVDLGVTPEQVHEGVRRTQGA